MAQLGQIDHFVVLMLENRSFDNLFGYLRYPPGVRFDGLTGAESNPDASGMEHAVSSASNNPRLMWLPDPDPGELFTDINEQIFGNPAGSGDPTMRGFVASYARRSGPGGPDEIMHCFAPGDVPALTSLAASFAVCDRWFAAAPCQTWPNRFFAHTATANGYENNEPVHFPYTMPTIFNALDRSAPGGWEIYFHDFPQSLTLSGLWPHLDHFHPFEDFLDDARNGRLPSYAFIEPRYFPDASWPNDMHPPHNVAYGDQLVKAVYEAVRNSPCWPSTLLVVTFDEHGGCYDHVAPPPAVPPEPPADGQVFRFDRFGVRVPAVVASPFIPPGTVFRSTLDQPFDHTSIVKTLRRRFGVDNALTARDAAAPDLEPVLALDTPSNAGPESLSAAPTPPEDDDQALQQARQAPLNHLQQAVHSAVGYLMPLVQAVSPADLISSLKSGYRGETPQASNSIDAVRNIRNILDKLLP